MSSRFYFMVLFQTCLLTSCASTIGTGNEGPGNSLGPNHYEVFGRVYEIMPNNIGYREIGIASWYGKKFHGRKTAMGEKYDMYGLSAAHKALPLPTMVRVTNLDNGRSIEVRVNDRGPFHEDRVIDLSYAAARALGFETKGTAPVVVEAIDEVNHPELAASTSKNQESYYLQVGAFQVRYGAAKHLGAVRNALPEGVPARILTSETDGGIFYKVWIGPLTSLEEEQIVAARIQDRNLGHPLRVTVD